MNSILYHRTPAPTWQQSIHKNKIQNPASFLQKHKYDIRYITVVSATGTYAIVSIELHDDPDNGVFDREFILEFDTRQEAIDWLALQGLSDYVVDYKL